MTPGWLHHAHCHNARNAKELFTVVVRLHWQRIKETQGAEQQNRKAAFAVRPSATRYGLSLSNARRVPMQTNLEERVVC